MFNIFTRNKSDAYKKGHLGQENTLVYDAETKQWYDPSQGPPKAATIAPPPKGSLATISAKGALEAEAASPTNGAGPSSSADNFGRATSLASRYAKPTGASQAGGSTPAVVLSVPGLAGRGRGALGGRGGRGGAIRTFVPQTSGAAAITPAWMTKKASAGSPSEETSSSVVANPFADPPPTDGPAPQPTPSVFMPAATAQDTAVGPSSFASPFASAPAASASSGMLTQLSQSSAIPDSAQLAAESAADDSYTLMSAPAAMDAESASPDVPADSAASTSQGVPALFMPTLDPSLDPSSTPQHMDETQMKGQDSSGRSPLDDAFGGDSSLDHTFGGGNGGGSALANTFGGGSALANTFGGGSGGSLDDAFNGGGGTGGGLDDAFNGGGSNGGGLDDAFNGGGGSSGGLDDAFGGGNGANGLDDIYGGSSLDDTFGGALMAGDIGQTGPMMPPADTSGDASGPKFPSRDGSETKAGEDFFGNLSGVEGGAVDDQEASSSSPALHESGGQDAPPQEEGAFDIDAMEVRASEAVQKDYHGLDWQRVMEIAQGWRDLGYPEEDVRLYLADYGIDMDVYGYWLWRYYPEWLVWWQNNASQADQEAQDSTATAEGAATAVDSAQESALEPPQEAQPMDSEQQPDESDTQADYPLSFSLGGDSEAVSEFPSFGVPGHPGDLEEMEIDLGGDIANHDESSPAVNGDDYAPESGAVSLEQPAKIESTAALHDLANMAAGPSQHDDSDESALMTAEISHQVDESAPALAAEDSFQADGRGSIAQTVQELSPRAQDLFGGNADKAPDTTWHNPVWDMSASPEQASRAPSPFFGVGPGVGATQSAGEASTSKGGVVSRELSFGLSSPQAGTQQENSALQAGVKQENGAPVQHVESLGAWAQYEAHRKPSIKLEGPLPWDLLSESSEEERTPGQARRTVEDLEEEEQDMQPEADGSAVPKAPAPEAAEATARTMSIGDQIAFGKRNVASLFQEASRGLGQQLRSSFALPSSSSPPKLYQRSPHLVQIYGDDSEEEEEDEAEQAVRPSGRGTPKAARRLSMGPDTPLDESPVVTPRSTQGPPSEEELAPTQQEQSEEAEPVQLRRKKTGDEPPSREISPEDHFAAKDHVVVDEEEQVGVDEEKQVWADEEEQESFEVAEDDVASDEGWEGMDDVEIPLPEDPTAVTPKAASEADPTTAVEAEPAVASAEDQQEQAGDHTVPEGPLGDDDNEEWEDMEDLTAPLEVAEAAEQAAAVEPEAAHEAESHEDGLNQQQETVGSPSAPSDLAGDQPAANEDPGIISRDEPIPNIFSGDDDAADEGWEGLHEQDVPAAEHADSSAHPEDHVAEPERGSAESEEGPSEREAHLEAQVEALRSELASRETQLASLAHQLGERDSASAELSTQTSELSSSHQQLTSELEDSRQQLSAIQAELDRSAQAAESWQSQLAALQASSAAEAASLRQQLTEAGEKSAEEEEKAWAAQQDADKWRSQFEELQASSKSATVAAAQNEEQLRQDIASTQSELASTLESHRATLAEIQGSLDEAREQLTAVTSDQSSLADQVAASSSELDSSTQQRDRAEVKCAELSEQLDLAAEQLRGSELMCSELRKEVEAFRETHSHQINDSESRHAELSEQLEETRAAHASLESEYELLTQQISGDGGKASPQSAGSPQRKAQVLLEELEDYRGKMGVADARIIDLEEQKAQLEEAKAAAEAASKEAFALREKQTERIKRTKAGGPAGLAVVTAEREDARRRAEQAEFEMHELRAECKSLMDRLQAQSASMQPVDSELSRSQVDSAPAQASDSPPSQAPASTQGDSSELNAAELTQQLEEAAVKISSLEANIVSLHAQVVTRDAEFESNRAALSTELALMTQQAEQLSSERDQASQRAESSFAERDSLAEKAREFKAELAESTLRTESLSAKKEELKQQLEGLLAGAEKTSEAQDEVQKLQGQLSQLQEQLQQQLQHKEEEVRRLEKEQGQLHQKVQSLEEEAQESFEQLTGKEEECDRLEALLETAREGNAQQAFEQLESLHADLASLRQQLMSSEEQVQVLEQDLQDQVGSSEALQAAEEQLSQATQAAQSLSAELESSQGESRWLRQEFAQQIEMLTQQLRDQVKETDGALQNALAAEKAKDKVDMEVVAVRARILDLEVDLVAAEGARDEFVYHLSPKKPPRPAGSPAPKANADQLRAALKAAREHAAGLEASAEREMASADEAYMLLGEAHSTMALYEAVLLQNDLDPEFVRSLNAGDASFSGDDEDDAVELASVASAAGDEDAVPSESGDDAGVPGELGDDSAVPGEAGDEVPESSHRGEQKILATTAPQAQAV